GNLVVAHLGKYRIHHHQKTQCNRDRDAADFEFGEELRKARDEPAEHEPRDHRETDPHREPLVEGGHAPRCYARRFGVSTHYATAISRSALRPATVRLDRKCCASCAAAQPVPAAVTA